MMSGFRSDFRMGVRFPEDCLRSMVRRKLFMRRKNKTLLRVAF